MCVMIDYWINIHVIVGRMRNVVSNVVLIMEYTHIERIMQSVSTDIPFELQDPLLASFGLVH